MFARIYGSLLLAGCVALSASAVSAETDDVRERVKSASAEAGEQVAMRCKACHTLDKNGANKHGPNLWGIVGSEQGEVEGFNYSKALTKLDGKWTLEELNQFLTNPRSYAPGNRMAFPGLDKASQRYDLLAYLSTLGENKSATSTSKAEAKDTSVKQLNREPTFADDLGLPGGEGREEVAALCSACHSLQIVKQQGLGTGRWDDLMDWMTEKQGMPELDPEDRTKIVSYLAEHYGPKSSSRGQRRMNPMMPRMPDMAPPQK